MLKNDFEIFITAFIVALIVAAANFEIVSNDLSATFEGIKQTEGYQSFTAYKTWEHAFWADLKGTKISGGDVSNILAENDQPTENTEKQPPPPADVKVEPPVKFLLVGDSMMLVGFGPALENTLLEYKDVSVIREGQYSTGLNRIDYYDWFTKTDELIAEHKPDVLIVMFGGNDGQGIRDREGKAHELGTASWSEVYSQRVNVYLTRVSPKVKKIYWVGHPIPSTDNFMKKFSAMNPVFKAESAKFPNAVYVDSWDRFAVGGKYSQTIPDDDGLYQIAKQSDGVHVTDFGGKILTGVVMKEILKDVEITR